MINMSCMLCKTLASQVHSEGPIEINARHKKSSLLQRKFKTGMANFNPQKGHIIRNFVAFCGTK
jgi:hypothetical protein